MKEIFYKLNYYIFSIKILPLIFIFKTISDKNYFKEDLKRWIVVHESEKLLNPNSELFYFIKYMFYILNAELFYIIAVDWQRFLVFWRSQSRIYISVLP